ncbi:MAG TPA: bestrophin family ion channel, partial [Chryseolinea sp.]
FYVGFKNNQSYERGWEARKVWGSIVNLSRAFAAASKAFLTPDKIPVLSDGEVRNEIRILLRRHLAWLHALKHAMRQRSAWEHDLPSSRRQRRYFERRINFSSFEADAAQCLSQAELEQLKNKHNKATQLLDMQAQHIRSLKAKGWLDDYKHVELQRFITDLYAEQGASERIKNTPLPRQYSTSSHLFIIIFTFLLPFAMLQEFDKTTDLMWLMLPFNLVVSWVFSLMEYTGDYSENPFEGLINDVPIYSIITNIEIDLKEMMNDTDIPERMKPVLDVIF